jgi:hypothetical protein
LRELKQLNNLFSKYFKRKELCVMERIYIKPVFSSSENYTNYIASIEGDIISTVVNVITDPAVVTGAVTGATTGAITGTIVADSIPGPAVPG